MAKASLTEIRNFAASYIDAQKAAGKWVSSEDSITNLVDTIGKMVTIDSPFTDKLIILDGEELPLGKTVEEWYQDLILPQAFNESGSNVDAPSLPTYRPASYSYALGKKSIKITNKAQLYEKASLKGEDTAALVEMVLRRLFDTWAQLKYDYKKELLGNVIKKVEAAQDPTGLSTFAYATAYDYKDSSTGFGDRVKDSDGNVYLCVKDVANTDYDSGDDLDDAIADGKFVKYDMITKIAKPVDTSTGEAFIQQVKIDIENASFASEGTSLNGATIGAQTGLVLFLKKGIKPVLDVQVEAGAFNPDKLGLPVQIITVDDFGADTTGTYGILMDVRGVRLHPTYYTVKSRENEEGDFINTYLHSNFTAFISRNTFIKTYKPAA